MASHFADRLYEAVQSKKTSLVIGLDPVYSRLPPAIRGRRGVIVWGHGLFTVGRNDFNEAFQNLLAVENMCREEYFSTVAGNIFPSVL